MSSFSVKCTGINVMRTTLSVLLLLFIVIALVGSIERTIQKEVWLCKLCFTIRNIPVMIAVINMHANGNVATFVTEFNAESIF